MCWQCEHPDRTRGDYLQEVVLPRVASSGWLVQAVTGDRLHAPFSYTVGLTGLGLPELVVTGLRARPAAVLLNGVAEHACHAAPPEHGEVVDLDDGTRLEAVDLPHPDAHLFVAQEVYGAAVRAMQLVWADDRGRWPWERGHRGGRGGQPVLGPRAVQEPAR